MSRLTNALRLASAELTRNWSRTALTSLGILIGVAAVIAMVGIGQGATASVAEDVAAMGSNLLMVEAGASRGPQSRSTARPFTAADLDRIRREVAHLSAVSPQVSASATAAYGGITYDTTVTGSDSGYLLARGWSLDAGRAFTEGEERSGAAVCLVGATVRTEVFGGSDPVGAQLRLGKTSCTVVGLLQTKGENTMGMDQDDLVLAPVGFVQRRLVGSTDISSIVISVDSEDHIDLALAGLELTLRDLRHVRSDDTVDYTIRDTREMVAHMSGITTVLTGFLSAVAGVSLLVGGIGIMNIMLVSVTERTREIGIRMSIGALEEDVMLQFLTEAMVLGAVGGAAGAVLGVALTGVGASLLDVPFVVEPAVVVGSVAFSALMGVGFGYLPARRAARLEPIDALRS
ncbi:MAG: ABC transporter permease [Alphaproteobacteria bacterium]|nr:ABC transporter permease [Alphaproteobacteria bacterium]